MLVSPAAGLLNVPTYVPGKAGEPGIANPVRLASNEPALGVSPKVVEILHDVRAEQLYRYPDPASAGLREAIARFYGLDDQHIVVGAGSETLIHLIARCYLSPGDEAIMSSQGFLTYRIATLLAGATATLVDDTPELKFDVDAVLERVRSNTKAVFIANPNNPTGTMINRNELARLRARLPAGVLLVIDAAYSDYVVDPNYNSGFDLISSLTDNVIVLGTFSKIFGLAGMRIGWACGGVESAAMMNRGRTAFPLAEVAEKAAIAALDDADHAAKERDHVSRVRPEFESALSDLGYRVTPGCANFSLFHCEPEQENAVSLYQRLVSQGIFVRPVHNYDLQNSLRVTIGKQEEMERVLALLRR